MLDGVMHFVGVRSKSSAFASAAAFAAGAPPACAAGESCAGGEAAAGAAAESCAAASAATSATAERTNGPSHRIEWIIVVTPARVRGSFYNVTRRREVTHAGGVAARLRAPGQL